MNYFNLYKKGRYGWFHVTSFKFKSLSDAIKFYKKDFNAKIGREIGNHKVSGL
jgi:predicted enzyme related to lactoylglutathione lyase